MNANNSTNQEGEMRMSTIREVYNPLIKAALADDTKAQKILGTKNQNGYIAQQGNAGGVYVSDEKSFYAVIMPVRCDAPEKAEFEKGLAKVQA